MQSLKSTAFAVTLLAISFGLYCVSNNNTATPENGLIDDPIQIDSSLSTERSGSVSLPSFDSQSNQAPIQISTNTAPALNSGTLPPLQQSNSFPGQSNSFPELPTLQTPNLKSSPTQFTSNTPALQTKSTQQTPLKLPSFSNPNTTVQNDPLELPKIATRQPVNSAPITRDDGLIDALKATDFKPQSNAGSRDNSFQVSPSFTTTHPAGGDNSFNSLATAVTKDNDAGSVSLADGLSTLPGASGVRNQAPPLPSPTSIANVWAEVDGLVAANEYRKALGALSQHYGKKGLTGPQQQKLQGWLDALAGKVIYSTEHHFVNQPYVVGAGETLESIAAQMKVPAEAIYNINRGQFSSSNEVSQGMELKVVNGPFHAEIDLESKMMTLFVKNLYAGRFPIAVGISGNPSEGNFNVMAKSPNGFTWRDATGKEYPAGSPGNGYGPYWIGLSNSLCIHAVPSGTPHGHRGCIGLSEKDAKDIFGILSKDSQLSIVR